ncbi:MAG: glycine--tRNA ligase [Candidatus Nanoarchaeia archaeon]|jgi:glycyl-tRNA synthetase
MAEEKKSPKGPNKSDTIMTIAAKRGFFYPSAEIYGAKAGFWTYGHMGTRLKHNWENLWRKYFLGLSKIYFEIEDCNILPKKVFEGSGHLAHFNDPMTECSKCNFRFRADQLIEDGMHTNVGGLTAEALTKVIEDNKLLCPRCGSALMPVKMFNMMFEMKVGAISEDTMYLRPESAQSPYLAFKREFEALRKKIPFGLAVVGRAFRNEISPRQGFFRLREFTQAELQIFFDPDKINEAENWDTVKNYKLRLCLAKDLSEGKITEISCEDANRDLKIPKFYAYNMAKVQQFYLSLIKIPADKFRLRELDEKERAFYNKLHFDVELNMDTLGGFKEVAGVHYRTNHDLGGHQECSKENLEVVIGDKRFIPHVLELSFGVDRNVWAVMDLFFREDAERTMFAFPTILSPVEVAVFPLVNKDNIPAYSELLYENLGREFHVFYDDTASIGRRYRRQDEIGTPFGITVDYDSLNDNTVTLRERDSMKQVRVNVDLLPETLRKVRDGKLEFEKAGTPVVAKAKEE